jgi:hypothetical protein
MKLFILCAFSVAAAFAGDVRSASCAYMDFPAVGANPASRNATAIVRVNQPTLMRKIITFGFKKSINSITWNLSLTPAQSTNAVLDTGTSDTFSARFGSNAYSAPNVPSFRVNNHTYTLGCQ